MDKKAIKRKINFVRMPIQNTLLKPNYRRNKLYANYYEKEKVVNDTILYESRDGKSLTDSPYAIFKNLITNKEYANYQHTWSIQNIEEMKPVMEMYKEYSNVHFVKRNSNEYLKALVTSQYLINNSTFQPFVIPKNDQIYINTWHGTPLKTMGFKIPGNPSNSQNVVRNFLSSDYLLSPNAHTTDMFTDSYKLDGLYSGEIIEDGYPRIDLTLNSDSKKIVEVVKSFGITLDENKETVLYAPTWKGKNVSQAKNDMFQIVSDMLKLKESVSDKYNVLIKVHPFLYEAAKQYKEISNILIPDSMDTNELLSIIDVLITDYSSIFFDFLVTNKPILYYMWDAESYSEERGSYFTLEELPGPILYTIQEVTEAVHKVEQLSKEHSTKYEQFKQKFTKYDDGNVSSRIADYIFKGKKNDIKVIANLDKKKQKILLYPGGMMNNGITSSCINLLNNIDYDKYDVSCFMKTPNRAEALNNIEKINKNARLLFRNGLPVYNTTELYRDKMTQNRGAHTNYMKKIYPEKAYQREDKRYFGKSNFDIAIDFSGYSLFWAKYILASNAKRKICYMHNDLLSDSERTINGKRPHRINLRGLFSIYDRFDKLVSVSQGTMELNKKNLKEFVSEDKFGFVLNSINPEKILKSSHEVLIEADNEEIESLKFVLKNNKFLSRALISNASNYTIWNKPVRDDLAKKVDDASHYQNQEVTISWEMDTLKGNYYKFSINNTIIGWLEKDAFKLLSDSILEETIVDKIVEITKPKGNAIWNKPYKVNNISRVSYSGQYKKIFMEVDKEVRTEHGYYSHLYLKNESIGWIDNRALKTIKDYNDLQLVDLNKINDKNKLLEKNCQENKLILDLWSKRVLRDKKCNKIGEIKNLKDYKFLSALPSNPKSREKEDMERFENETVQIKRMVITKTAVYYLIYHEDQRLGWLNRKALRISTEIRIISEKEVKRTSELNLSEDYSIYTLPYGMTGSKELENIQQYVNERFSIDKEVRTQNGQYCRISLNEEFIGWINKNALTNLVNYGIEIGNSFIMEPSKDNINFVNMGRLSPEKAQDNLIKAFAEFHKKQQHSRLYILGSGPLKEDLQSLIEELSLTEAAYLVGQQENPFKLMHQCDCFVLSSHYEGQPMVLLEAMTLGLDIIATDIIANRTVLENGRYGLLVENTLEGLEDGMTQFALKGDKPLGAMFDYKTYNQEAMHSFYNVVSVN